MLETVFPSYSIDYGYLEEAAITAQPPLVSETDGAHTQLTLANEEVIPDMKLTTFLPEHDYLRDTNITTQPLTISEADRTPSQPAPANEPIPDMALLSSSTDYDYLEQADGEDVSELDDRTFTKSTLELSDIYHEDASGLGACQNETE
ncbi:hypothetical protein GQ607_002364 [Colletotrichum asianum]|uniref:Uncharacterized protein n=1 Tax=Colletotrichum asianum TaxID=702518 RepID=A0A8H3WPN9_9PEZI|nr:hypothetical protein GQ607_002364 [Colletotrichum asianum]